MSAHLSALELDEVAAGLVPAPPHLSACAECTGALEKLQAHNAAFLARPEAKAHLEKLLPPPDFRSRRRALWLVPALAAGVALLVLWPREVPEDRLKGAPTVVLLDASGAPVTQATAGQKLTLAVGGAGANAVTVFAVDAAGTREQIFAGAIAAGARVPVMQLEVTPGDVTVQAEFNDGRRAEMRLRVP